MEYSSDIALLGDRLICPRGNGEGSPIEIDIKDIAKAEHRLVEVQSVTRAKAKELEAFFNIMSNKLNSLIAFITREKDEAIRCLSKRKAVLLLDNMQDLLKEKGLFKQSNPAGSEDIRECVYALDPEYDNIVDRINQLKALAMLLEGKNKAFIRGYFSVQAITKNEKLSVNDGSLLVESQDDERSF